MPRSISRTPVHVCPIAQNCLAVAYIEGLLNADTRIRSLNPKQCACLSPASRRKVIFVIDLCGLPIPLRECLRRLREQCPNARFLVLDQLRSKEEIARILVMGVQGYVHHAEASDSLVRAICAIAANQLWVPPEVLPEFLREVSGALRKDAQGRQTTTAREDDILELVRRRLSNREIADLLQIRVSTVKFHLSNVLSKLHAKNRRELTSAGSQEQWRMQLQ